MIVQLFPDPEEDAVLETHVDGSAGFIAFVVGEGECPHVHRRREHAELCGGRMRRWIDEQEARATSGWHRDEAGREFIRVVRRGPGRRPSRRPW